MADRQSKILKLFKVLLKLDHPPAGPNWVRFIFDDPTRTAKAIVRFAKSQPPFNYHSAYAAIKDRIELGISLEVARKSVTMKGAPSGRSQNRELVEAFFKYDLRRQYSASNPITFEREFFRVSRDVVIPIAPLSIIRERGTFVPIFVCGWSSNPLFRLQRRLLMTIYEDAFLSLTDYQNSPAEVLFFPRNDEGEEPRREPEVWHRGDYELLSKRELDECVEIFIFARNQAREVLLAEIDQMQTQAEAEKSAPATPLGDQPDLFKKQ